ncbi:MAG TPA: NUDIX hydrolase [Polyangiaceae bacterium]|nr:NUDIX hydrolase [Polyangiaceae bacterium]
MSEGDEFIGLPRIRLEQVRDLSPDSGEGFLRLVRRELVAHYPDGSRSEPFVYDEVDRRAIDATVIAAHFVRNGERRVYLRSAIRPPLYFRDPGRAPVPVPARGGGLWELPAGLVEVSEQSPEGLRASAARELAEEAGFSLPPDRMLPLGPSMYPCPGVLSERHFYFEALVDPAAQESPSLDGSALEKDGRVIDVSLAAALEMCRTGEIEDAKTEICLRRLAERYP